MAFFSCGSRVERLHRGRPRGTGCELCGRGGNVQTARLHVGAQRPGHAHATQAHAPLRSGLSEDRKY